MSRAPRRLSRAAVALFTFAVILVAACTGPVATEDSTTDSASAVTSSPLSAIGGIPAVHVHGVDLNPGDGLVYLATHAGLYRLTRSGAEQVGPMIDLMGFAVAGANHFFASGHPGPDTGLADPAGLIESTDGGQHWKQRSLSGQADFHTVAAAGNVVVAFDGELRVSGDGGGTWSASANVGAVRAVAAAPGGDPIIAAIDSGLFSFTGTALTRRQVPGAPPVVLMSWAVLTGIVGVTADGTVYVSDDAGLTWRRQGMVGQPVQAITAYGVGEGHLAVLVVTASGLLQSLDGGAHFVSYVVSD